MVQHGRMQLRKAELELLRYVTDDRPGTLAKELAAWLDGRRFAAFVSVNRDKVRKKIRSATDDDASAGVRAELMTAQLLLADRRFEITPEAYGSGKRGPDLTMTFRSTYRFNIEVTQLRSARLPYVLLAKLRQLPAGIANVLIVVVPTPVSATEIATATRLLKTRAERSDDAFFAAYGLTGARSFYAHYRRLSAVCVMDTANAAAAFWTNPEAKHSPSAETARALQTCLGARLPGP